MRDFAVAIGLADDVLQALVVDLEVVTAAIEIKRQRARFANGCLRGFRPTVELALIHR